LDTDLYTVVTNVLPFTGGGATDKCDGKAAAVVVALLIPFLVFLDEMFETRVSRVLKWLLEVLTCLLTRPQQQLFRQQAQPKMLSPQEERNLVATIQR
jgi:hypothetical protein